jgi:dolichol-phosphate mannosyltransferase
LRLSVVVPCFNEEANVRQLRERLFPVLLALPRAWSAVEVVLVDDGSGDDTWREMQALAALPQVALTVRPIRHAANAGLGAALRTGLGGCTGDVIVTTDSDATYRFEEIPAILCLLAESVDIVTASPYHPGGSIENVPGHRLVLSRGASLLYRVLVDPDIHTWTALFRVYRRHVIESVPFAATGFLAGTELLVNALAAGYRVVEYPTVLRSRVLGTSKAKLARTVLAHLGFQVSVARRRLRHSTPRGLPALTR